MSRLLTVGNRFRAVYKKLDGTSFYGQMLSIPDTSRVTNFLTARRYLRTQPNTNLNIADVVVINGEKYITAEHGTGHYVIPIYKHFKLFEVTEEAQWYKAELLEDPVTGIKQIVREKKSGIVYLSTQPKTDIEDAIQIQSKRKSCICNAPVKVDDKIGEYIVTKADPVLGVTLLELKRQ